MSVVCVISGQRGGVVRRETSVVLYLVGYFVQVRGVVGKYLPREEAVRYARPTKTNQN
jgi:hypothetical protein